MCQDMAVSLLSNAWSFAYFNKVVKTSYVNMHIQ